MGKFLDSLQIATTWRTFRQRDFKPFFPNIFKDMSICESFNENKIEEDNQEYEMWINWCFKSHCPQGKNREAALEAIKQLALCHLRKAIYGEFEDELTKLYIAIEERDAYKAKNILINIMEMVK